MERGHTEALFPMVLDVLGEAECGFDSLDWLAVTIGPGSFTGVRAGLAAARGLALARALPVMGLDCFAAVLWRMGRKLPESENAADGRRRVVALDSRRKEIYLRIFSSDGEPRGEPILVAPGDVAERMDGRPAVLGGDAASDVEGALRQAGIDASVAPECDGFEAADVAELAVERIAARAPGDDPPRPTPLYLHPTYAVAPAVGGRVRA